MGRSHFKSLSEKITLNPGIPSDAMSAVPQSRLSSKTETFKIVLVSGGSSVLHIIFNDTRSLSFLLRDEHTLQQLVRYDIW